MNEVTPSLRALVSVWLAAVAGFAILAAFAGAQDTFPGDVSLAQRLQEVDSSLFARLLDWVEDLTDLPLLVVIYAVVAVALYVRAGRETAVLLLFSVLGRGVNSVLKEIIDRPRPSAVLVDFTDQPSSLSFPSGHSEGAMVLYGLIFYFAGVYVKEVRLRAAVQIGCAAIVIATGIERVYAGHHWPSDVIGGWYIGGLVLAACIAIHRLVILRRSE